MIEVLHPGLLTTIQDLGRPGLAHLGIPRSGAADRPALRAANRLVGNPDGAPGLESTMIGPRLRFLTATSIALTGAPVDARLVSEYGDQRPVAMEAEIALDAGEELIVGTARSGLRTYIAVAGGLDVTPALGSASTDVLTGLGPAPIAAGDRLRIGGSRSTPDARPRAAVNGEPRSDGPFRVVLGPRDDWFTADGLTTLLTTEFSVTPSVNRIGIRLQGPELARSRAGELPSEGMVPGAVQVPLDGQPIVLLVDHPTTGGYPVIAVVAHGDLARLGQLRPGDPVRFQVADLS